MPSIRKLFDPLIPSSLRDFGQRMVVDNVRAAQHLDMLTRLRHLRDLGYQPARIVDIGAAKGNWARMIADVWPSAAVLGIEPNQSMKPFLEQAAKDLRSFQFTHAFAGETTKTVEYVDAGVATSLNEQVGRTNAGNLSTAQVRPLDNILGELNFVPADFIKLDVQGYELSVLAGATQTLQQCSTVLIEVNFFKYTDDTPLAADVIQFMRDRDFEWHEIMGALRRPRDGTLGQMDLMFVKRDHALRSSQRWS